MQYLSPCIAREAELSALMAYCAAAARREGSLVLLAGEAGVGKTHLVHAALQAGELRSFRGRAMLGTPMPYRPVVELLRQALRQSATEVSRLGSLSPYLNWLLPELGEQPPGEPEPDTLAEAVCAALTSLARTHPTCVVLEDLQWSDHATLGLLALLAERVSEDALLILGLYRPEEITGEHPIRRLRDHLRRAGLLHEIDVRPFSSTEATRLMTTLLGGPVTPALATLLYDKTHGLPLFLEELCTTLVSRGLLERTAAGLTLPSGERIPLPESIRDAMLLRLGPLSTAARRLLEAAAVIGPSFEVRLASDLAGEDTALDELIAANLLVEIDRQRGAFRHLLMREVVLDGLGWSTRRALNRRLASALEASGAPPELIGRHYLAAGEWQHAREAFLKAADQACRIHAYRDAAGMLREALHLWPHGRAEAQRLQALKRLGYCTQLAGQLHEAVQVWRDLLESLAEEESAVARAEVHRSLGTAYALQGASDHAVEAHRAAARLFEDSGNLAEAAVELLAGSDLLAARVRLRAAEDAAASAAALAEKVGRNDLRSQSLSQLAYVRGMQGRSTEAHEHVSDALALAGHDPEVTAAAYRRLAYVHAYASDYGAACKAFETAIRFCRREKIEPEVAVCLGCMAYALFRRGEWRRAQHLCRGVASDDAAPEGAKTVALMVLGLVHTLRGEAKQGRRHLLAADRLAQRLEYVAVVFYTRWGLALLDEREGRDAAARLQYESILALWAQTEDRLDVVPSLFSAARFLARHGLGSATNHCAEILGTITSASGNPEPLAALAYVLGEVAWLEADYELAAQQFLQALTRLEQLGVPCECAVAGWRAGQALMRTAERAAGLDHLHRSYRTARTLGARPLAAEIARTLVELGEPVDGSRRSKASGRSAWGGLTRRQREVAEHLALGLTNKEIAHRLYISPRTVDMHVGHILTRLDCRTRAEAVRKLARMGVLTDLPPEIR